MSLPVTFHRAASAEFVEASTWYEAKRVGLALEFMAKIDRCVSLASEYPFRFFGALIQLPQHALPMRAGERLPSCNRSY